MFKVFKSSAGSGKTYALTKEYLKLVLVAPYTYKRILAITFTNKAANEMKERIIKQLSILCYDENYADNPLTKDLQKETELTFSQLRTNAKQVLQNILHHYSDFSVSTIDSFTHKITSTFAFDLNLPLNFDVALENDKIISDAVTIVMTKIGNDEELTKTLLQFAENNLLQEKNWQIDADLRRLSSEVFKEDTPVYLKKIKQLSLADFRQIANQLYTANAQFKAKIEKIAQSAFENIQQQGLTEDDFYRGKQGIYSYFKSKLKFDKEKLLPNSYVSTTLQDDKWYSAKITDSGKQKIDSIKPTLIQAAEQLQNIWDNELESFFSQELLLENLYSLALLNEISRVIQEYSKENNLVHISENNKRIAEFIAHEPVPFIYERTGEKYDHYFIDEFQDTSILQWHNLLPLIENGLSKDKLSIVVGDAKQAIYRFRQGEVEQFIDLPDIYKRGNAPFWIEREAILNRNFKPEVLNYNYRSCSEVVNFNNLLFEFSAQYLTDKYKPIYLGNEAKNDPGLKQKSIKEGGYVCIQFSGKEDYKQKTCEKVLQVIVESKNAGYTYSDMVILARSKNELNTIAEYLNRQQIDGKSITLVSSESFQLWKSPEVRFLYSLLQFLENNNNLLAQAQILHFLEQKGIVTSFEKETYFVNLYTEKQGNLLQLLNEKNILLYPKELLQNSIYDIVENLIRITGLSADPNAYITTFLNFSANWIGNPNQNLSDYLQTLDEEIKTICIKIPDDLNAIRLMTIHKSKGLEFPIVIYPFADTAVKTQDNLWVENGNASLQTGLIKAKKEVEKSQFKAFYEEEQQKSVLDLLNMFYVALTRASEHLYILAKEAPKKSETLSCNVLLKEYLIQSSFWNDGQTIYEFGNKVTKPSTGEKSSLKQQISLDDFNSNAWSSKISINYRVPANWKPDKTEAQIEKGVLLHKALSYINRIPDIRQAINRLVKENLLAKEEVDTFEKHLIAFLSNPLIKPFFEENIQAATEQEVILGNGKTLRPDRIIYNSNETIVIDFKTGKPLPSHEEQILNYKTVLTQMGHSNVKAFLIYLQGKESTKLIEI